VAKKKQAQRKVKKAGSDDRAQRPKAAKKRTRRKATKVGPDDRAQRPKAAKKRTRRKAKKAGSDDQAQRPKITKKRTQRKVKKAGSGDLIQQGEAAEQVGIPERAETMIPKPGKLIVIGGLRLGSGVCNVLAGFLLYWLVFPLVLIPFGVVEIVSGINLLREKPKRPLTLRVIPILEIVAIVTLAAWVSMVAGVLSLIFLSDEHVKSYLGRL